MRLHLPNPDPRTLARGHFVMMFVWATLLIPTLIWWKESILWVAAMSLYANFVGHFSAWDGARAEMEVEQMEESSRGETSPAHRATVRENVPVVTSLQELATICRASDDLYLRVAKGPLEDVSGGSYSTDHASGLALPGLSAIPLSPPKWWRDRPDDEWVARQVRSYAHLVDDDNTIWVLRGTEAGRGPDNEPLIEVADVVARLDHSVIDESDDRRPVA